MPSDHCATSSLPKPILSDAAVLSAHDPQFQMLDGNLLDPIIGFKGKLKVPVHKAAQIIRRIRIARFSQVNVHNGSTEYTFYVAANRFSTFDF